MIWKTIFQRMIVLHYLFFFSYIYISLLKVYLRLFLLECLPAQSVFISWPSASDNLTFKWKPLVYSFLLFEWFYFPHHSVRCSYRFPYIQKTDLCFAFSNKQDVFFFTLCQCYQGTSGPFSCLSLSEYFFKKYWRIHTSKMLIWTTLGFMAKQAESGNCKKQLLYI